jgi:tetratricopeptide (TPR) repeat protein
MRTVFDSLAITLVATLVAMSPIFARTDSPANLEVLTRLAEERYAEGDLERSATLYLEIAALQESLQDRAEALFTASWLQFLAEQEIEALGSLTRALTLEPEHLFDVSLYTPDFEILYRQALSAAQHERKRLAKDTMQQALIALEAGRSEEARSELLHTLELDPDNPVALYNLALIEMDSEDQVEALSRFERVVALTYRDTETEMTELRARSLTSIGVLYHRQERYQDAEQSFMEATRADPREATAWKNLGTIHLDQQHYSEAADALERAHELSPDDRSTTSSLAKALQMSGRSGQAAALLKTDLKRHPDDAELWLELATIESQEGIQGDAVYAFERAIDADPGNRSGIAVPAATLLAEHLHEQEEYARAVDASQQAVTMDPKAARAWQILGRSQLESGDKASAIASLTRSAELQTDSIESQLFLADAYVDAKQLQAAEGAYLRALSLDPSSLEASAGLKAARMHLSSERAIVNGATRPRKPIRPKQIGVQFKDLDYDQLQLRGALVKDINKKSPAARAGLRKGDLVLWIGSYEVLSDKDFLQYIKRNPPGDALEIEYLRDGRIYEASIQLR